MDTSQLVTIIDKIGGRKLLATVIVLGAGGVALAFKGDVPANYLALLQTAMGAFVGGNIAEHWAKNIKAARSTGESRAQWRDEASKEVLPVVAAVNEKVDAVGAQTKANTELLMTIGQSVHSVTEILAEAKSRAATNTPD